MTISITHTKVSGKAAGTDSTRVYGTHWDAAHTLTGTVSNAQLDNMVEGTIKGRALGAGTGVPTDLTPAQAKTALALATSTTANAVIRADGTAGGTQNSGVTISDADNLRITGTGGTTTSGEIGFTSGTLNYGDGSSNRVVVSTNQTQTLSSKTLTAPVVTTSMSLDAAAVAGSIVRMYNLPASTSTWVVQKPDGTFLSIAGSTTDGLQEAIDYATTNGFALKVTGYGYSQPAGIAPQLSMTTTLNVPPTLQQSITFENVVIFAQPSDFGAGIIFDSGLLLNWDFRALLLYEGDDYAVRFKPVDVAQPDNTAQIIISRYYFSGVVVRNVTGRTPLGNVYLDPSAGSIRETQFSFGEVFGAGGPSGTAGQYGIVVANTGAGTYFENNRIDASYLYSMTVAGVQVGVSTTNQANLRNNKWVLGSVQTNGASSDIFNTYGSYDTVDVSMSNQQGTVNRGVIFEPNTVGNRVVVRGAAGVGTLYTADATATGNLLFYNGSVYGTPSYTDGLIISDAGAITAGRLGYTAGTLNYGDGAATQTLVATTPTQTLSNKTLTDPVVDDLMTFKASGTDRFSIGAGTDNVLAISGYGNNKTAALHLNPGSGTVRTDTVSEFVLQRTADQAFGGNYGRNSFTSLGTDYSNADGIYFEFGGTVTPGPFIFNLGYESPASTFTSTEFLRFVRTGTDLGASYFGVGQTTPIDVIQLVPGNVTLATQYRNSHAQAFIGNWHNGSVGNIKWREYVEVLDQNGTSRFVWTSNLNGAGNVARATLTDAGVLTLASVVATTASLSNQLTSTLATGTAPFVIASTTKVDNLHVARATLADTVTTNANLTGDVTSSGNATTLATVNSNVGSFGSATQVGTFTVNAKGLLTAAANTTVTPAVGSITGLGTGVATALAVNVGSAGAPVVNGGALGSPSSAGTIPAFTLGGTVSGGNNQLNDVIIGTSSPRAGSFTTIAGSGIISLTNTTAPTGAGVGAVVVSGGVYTAKGIGFPSTQVASSDVNVLDDYEEGTWAPTYGGFSAAPSGGIFNYIKVGKMVTVWASGSGAGTSNANTKTITLPFAAARGDAPIGMGLAYDNSAFKTNPCRIDLTASSATATVYLDLTAAAWTTSGGCTFYFSFTYEATE